MDTTVRKAVWAGVALCVWLSAASAAYAQSSGAEASDPWWGPDKALHLSVSAAISVGSYAVSIPLLDAPSERALVAASVGIAAGAAKELWDLSGRGDASWRDMTWNVIGVALGTFTCWLIDVLLRTPERAQPTQQTGRRQTSRVWPQRSITSRTGLPSMSERPSISMR